MLQAVWTLAVLLAAASVSHAQTGAQARGESHAAASRVGAAVQSALQQKHTTRVIVAFAIDGGRRLQDLRASDRRAEVSRARERILSSVPASQLRVERTFGHVNAFVGEVTAAGLAALLANPHVLRVDEDAPVEATLVQSLPLAQISVVKTQGYAGTGVTTAVLDTGYDTNHPDLADSLVAEACFCGAGCCPGGGTTQTGAGSAEDDNGHGTNVSGIITGNGTVAPQGGAPDAGVIAIKVLSATGSGNASDTVAGLDWLIDEHPEVRVVNMSLGSNQLFTGTCDTSTSFNIAYAAAIDTLRANGVATFVSTGNSRSSTQLSSPACIASSIAVGAVWDSNLGQQTFLSCHEATAADKITCFTNSNSTMDIVAPGAYLTATGMGGGQSTYGGTSQASPAAAACAADLFEAVPQLAPATLENAMEASPNVVVDGRNGLSFPRVHCADALARITAPSVCGNSVIEGGESCDDGNTAAGDCCSASCFFEANGSACAADALPCTADVCNGMGSCTHLAGNATATCRPAAGVCDVAEACSGTSTACPVDARAGTSTVCRSAAGVCDPLERCTGTSTTCPADVFSPTSTTCRSSAGVCDVVERCTGASAECAGDGFAATSTTCRSSAGVCDIAEQCTGSTVTCPSNAFSTSVCRAATAVCDAAESCTGTSSACPSNAMATTSAVCRPASGSCDVVEVCSGTSLACPVDAFVSTATFCRSAAGSCDVAEQCNGTSGSCPADTVLGSVVTCRAAAGVCDVAETCSGSAPSCPGDGLASTSAVCRSAAGECDIAERCTGAAPSCPADALASPSTPCTADSNGCTDDRCNGSGACTHPPNAATCSDGEFCNGADTCAGGSCSVHAGDPCSSIGTCDEGADACEPCVRLSLPELQRCRLDADCTLPIDLDDHDLPVASLAATVTFPSAADCMSCTAGTGATNATCTVDSSCNLSLADEQPPVNEFAGGQVASVVVRCSETGQGEVCLDAPVMLDEKGSPVPVCAGPVCAPFTCAECIPGDCNGSGDLDAGDPICAVLCVIDDPPEFADCECAADCNCSSVVEVGDPICTVQRLIDNFSPDPCTGGAP